MQEIEQHVTYPTTDKFNSLDYNKFEIKFQYQKETRILSVDFLEMVPELYRDLHTFRITGGEPLLSNDTWKVLDYILEQKEPNKNLNLSINSNLGYQII